MLYLVLPVLKPDIITELELHRDKELAERKEKRKKLTEEEAKKEKDRLEKESKTSDENKTEKKEEVCCCIASILSTNVLVFLKTLVST